MRSCWRGPSWNSEKSSMKPSSLRILAMASLVREAGTSTSSCRAWLALRMRVSMSAMGSEMFMGLPARLGHARQLAQQGPLPEADAAQREPAHIATRPTAHGAPVVAPDVEALLALGLGDEGLLGHPALLLVSWRTACRGATAAAWTPRRWSPS